MSVGVTNGAEMVRWDLGPLYQGPDDPAIARDEAEVDRLVEAFQGHRGSIGADGVEVAQVAAILTDLEKIPQIQLDTYKQILENTNDGYHPSTIIKY